MDKLCFIDCGLGILIYVFVMSYYNFNYFFILKKKNKLRKLENFI